LRKYFWGRFFNVTEYNSLGGVSEHIINDQTRITNAGLFSIPIKWQYKKGKDGTEKELISHGKDQITQYKAPKSIKFKNFPSKRA